MVGAGFISGREIVAFFGTESFLPFITASFFLLAALFYLAYSGEEKAWLKQENKAFDVAAVISSFISACGVLAGLDFLFKTYFACGFPVLSTLSLCVASAVAIKGVKGVEKFTLAAVPVIIVIIVYLIFNRGETDFSTGKVSVIKSGVKTLLYASMNFFVNLPALKDCAYRKSTKARVVSAVLSAFILCFLAAIIAAAIKAAATENYDAPLLFAVGLAPVFSVALFFALETSLFSAYYPAFYLCEKKFGATGGVCVAIAAFTVSRLGVKGIIDGLYPVIGAFGTAYVIKTVFAKITRYKKRAKEHNR